jgi:nicotinamide-nucleotide amidase
MGAIVLSVGAELLRGDIVDTNATFLSRRLSELGFTMARVVQVGDDLDDLSHEVSRSLEVAGVLVCTGGLGPTEDDLTREAIAAALDEELFLDASLAADVESRFASLRRTMPKSNLRQAMRIPSATPLPNPHGTAPGWLVRRDRRVIIALPGPPREMQPMWTDRVEPQLHDLIPGGRATASLMTFGLGESMLERKIADIIHRDHRVAVATYAKANGVEVHVTARATTDAEASYLCSETEQALRERLGEAVFGTGTDTLSEAVASLLGRSQLTLATMESVTGGDVSNVITNNAGSSVYFLGGVIAYSRQVKERYGVDPNVIDRFGMISAETAQSMADAVRRSLDADIGVATSGIAGKEAVEGRAPGTCFVAVSMDGVHEVREIHRPAERDIAKRYFAQCALDLLRRALRARGTVPA